MDNLIGKIVKVESDQENIWFSLKVRLTSGISLSEQEVYFDCRIAKIDDNEMYRMLKSQIIQDDLARPNKK